MKHRKKTRLSLFRKNPLKRKDLNMSYQGQIMDLGDVEETRDRSFFLKISQDAATNAVNENKAMHIPITFLQDGWIVRRMPTGDIEKIYALEIKNGNEKFKGRRIAKGTILNVSKTFN